MKAGRARASLHVFTFDARLGARCVFAIPSVGVRRTLAHRRLVRRGVSVILTHDRIPFLYAARHCCTLCGTQHTQLNTPLTTSMKLSRLHNCGVACSDNRNASPPTDSNAAIAVQTHMSSIATTSSRARTRANSRFTRAFDCSLFGTGVY
jgi:hypothetical protein